MKILAIETSCDETAAAVVSDGTKILSSVIASSTDMHKKWGGIVPEVAAREQLKCILPVIEEALNIYSSSPSERLGVNSSREVNLESSRLAGARSNNIKDIVENSIDAIAVTVGPGLIGSLLVGVETAKSLAFVTGKPVIPVNHVLAHMYANFLGSDDNYSSRESRRFVGTNREVSDSSRLGLPREFSPGGSNNINFPAISLVVSGGHTELYLLKSVKDVEWLGGTLDDAAGEAFDKTARLLGFGSRGGPAIQEAAQKFQISNIKSQIKLPRPLLDGSLNFSFSGLKTAVLREVNHLMETQLLNSSLVQQLSFEVQEAVTDVLVKKTLLAVEKYEAKSILISGGVAANLRLREKFNLSIVAFHLSPVNFYAPPPLLCTDNAGYIGAFAFFRGQAADWHTLEAIPDLSVEVIT